MKKLVSCLLSATLSAAVLLSFAGCQWDAGGSNFTPSDEWIAAAAAYNAKVAEIETAVENEAEYTKTSREALKEAYEALPTFKTAGHTPEEIYAQIEALNALCEETLETPDGIVDKRIEAAINALKLFVTYGEKYNDKIYYSDSKHPVGSPVYFKQTEDGNVEVCEKDDEGAYTVANKGVDKITYDKDNNHATFYLSGVQQGSQPMELISFVDTDVLTIFDNDFNDLFRAEFIVDVYLTPDATEKTTTTIVMDAENSSGMYLAAGLLAVCAGLEQELYDMFAVGNIAGFNDLLRTMKSANYSLIAGKTGIATITLKNDNYIYTSTLSVSFTEIPTI